MWTAVLAAGAFVLLPGAMEYLQARQLEAAEQAELEGEELRMGWLGRVVWWLSHDPRAGRKLLETDPGGRRSFEEVPEGALLPSPSPHHWESLEIPVDRLRDPEAP